MTQPRSADRREKARLIGELIAANIRDHRLRQGMTQKECSTLVAGASDAYWRQMESGHKDVSVLRLVEIAEVLGVEVGELFKGV